MPISLAIISAIAAWAGAGTSIGEGIYQATEKAPAPVSTAPTPAQTAVTNTATEQQQKGLVSQQAPNVLSANSSQ